MLTDAEDAILPKAAPCRCKFEEQETSRHVLLSLDAEVVDYLRAMGADWEMRFNAILREWLQTQVTRV